MSEKKQDKPRTFVKETPGSYWIEERFEIIGGVRYDFLSSPKISHQILVTELYASIRETCHSQGITIVAPMDVHLDEENIVQPDLIFIRHENLHIIRDGFVKGAPDLLIEILSPRTGSKDKVVKKALYERFGVKEYWIVDPLYATVDQFVLTDGVYALAATYDDQGMITSPLVPCLSLDLNRLFREALRFEEKPSG
ncbi:Uma2 family endonuclease [Paenibacillus sp. TH7-28]